MKRGVSIATLTATITIILILITTITISASNMSNNIKRSNFATEINLIQKSVDSYLLKNENDYPILDSVILDLNNVSSENRLQFVNNGENVTDNKVGLFNIDYEKIGYTDLKYGNKKNGANDIYVLSGLTGKVYYAAGFKVGDKVYYTLTDELSKSIEYKTIDSVSDEGNKVISYSQENIDDSQKKVKIKVPVNYMVTSITAGDYNYTYTTVDGYNVYEVICNAGTLIDIAYTHNGESKSTSYTVKANDDKTDEGYAKDGLLLHYDGINNTGNGHSSTATVWKDLSGNGNDGTLANFDIIDWEKDTKKQGLKFYVENSNVFNDLKYDFKDITVEIVADEIPSTKNYGFRIASSKSGRLCSAHFKWTNSFIYFDTSMSTDASIYNRVEMKVDDDKGTFTFSKSTTAGQSIYLNSNKIAEDKSLLLPIGSSENFYLGNVGYTQQTFRVYSVRIYNRALTDEEIKQNYNVDKSRFGI